MFTDLGVAFRLNRFLYALCWIGTERPSALFERAIAWLLAAKVLLPGCPAFRFWSAQWRGFACAPPPTFTGA